MSFCNKISRFSNKMFSLSDSISQLSVGDLSFIGRNMVGVTKTQEKMRETQNGIANGSRRRTRSHLVNADVGRGGGLRRPDAAVRDPYHSRYEISPNSRCSRRRATRSRRAQRTTASKRATQPRWP